MAGVGTSRPQPRRWSLRSRTLVAGWAVLAAGALVSACGGHPARPAMRPLAIFYSSTPWEPDSCRIVDCGAKTLSRFADVVLTTGLEDPASPGHRQVVELIHRARSLSPTLRIWGYVSIIGGPVDAQGRRQVAFGVADILAQARQWRASGAQGVFLDEVNLCGPGGPTCSTGPAGPIVVDCARMQDAIAGIHALGLAVFANGGAPADVLGPCEGRPTPLGPGEGHRPGDMFLVENPTVVLSVPNRGDEAAASVAKLDLAGRLARAARAGLAVVDTDSGATVTDPFGHQLEQLGWKAALAAGASSYCFTNEYYSASVYPHDLALAGPDGVSDPSVGAAG